MISVISSIIQINVGSIKQWKKASHSFHSKWHIQIVCLICPDNIQKPRDIQFSFICGDPPLLTAGTLEWVAGWQRVGPAWQSSNWGHLGWWSCLLYQQVLAHCVSLSLPCRQTPVFPDDAAALIFGSFCFLSCTIQHPHTPYSPCMHILHHWSYWLSHLMLLHYLIYLYYWFK